MVFTREDAARAAQNIGIDFKKEAFQLEDLLNGMNTEVALLAEGVDRNFVDAQIFSPFDVALLAEGVDRNRD